MNSRPNSTSKADERTIVALMLNSTSCLYVTITSQLELVLVGRISLLACENVFKVNDLLVVFVDGANDMRLSHVQWMSNGSVRCWFGKVLCSHGYML
jgi:hypothetical protein